MISLNDIVSSNLEMLKEQEASLTKSLDFVRKAIELFQAGSKGAPGKRKRGRPRGLRPGATVAKAAVLVKATKAGAKTRRRKGGKHIDRIIAVLKEKKAPVASADLIQNLFKAQTKDKDIKHFST